MRKRYDLGEGGSRERLFQILDIVVVVIFILLVVFLGMTLSQDVHTSGPVAPTVEYWEYVDVLVNQTVLRAVGTSSSTGWTANPNDGVLWDKLLTNDTNTTDIASGSATAVITLEMANLNYELTDQDVASGDRFLVVDAWAIYRVNASGSSFALKAKILTYGFVSRGIAVGTATGVWHNMSMTMYSCMYHNDAWWGNCVNYTFLELSTGVIGKIRVTEIGLIVSLYERTLVKL